eukprot:TRINITY_DN17860_c0_g1_i1.p1 TRINITY_DN17860_c0_g1~~TRINITY_DN17860_c0_g1_i1.p1  ORF type:complete len:309 (+),score=41.64 TRINITY_DN17860_c0_g1_i1:38-964(+)
MRTWRRVTRTLPFRQILVNTTKRTKFSQSGRDYRKIAVAGAVGVAGGLLVANSFYSVKASSQKLPPAAYPWTHRLPWQALDHASIRRGHQVYAQVCATCHSMNGAAFRELVDVCYTEEEAKALASEHDYPDLDEEGYATEREGKLADYFPSPYQNEVQARVANNGAIPPDLTSMAIARDHGEDYIFALLTGYKEPPAGIEVREGLQYNPYFPGGAIAMPQPITDEMVEFEDGTEGSLSQAAKDVTTFLMWTASPDNDARKRMLIKVLIGLAFTIMPMVYYKRLVWSIWKTQVTRLPVTGKELYRRIYK